MQEPTKIERVKVEIHSKELQILELSNTNSIFSKLYMYLLITFKSTEKQRQK